MMFICWGGITSRYLKAPPSVLQCVWDELDAWHSRLMLLESEVQDLAEDQPHQAHLLIDHITQPLQLYQTASQMAENRTSFLSKVRHTLLQDIYTGIVQVASKNMLNKTTFCFLFSFCQIPACLQEFEDILFSATCWLDEAQSWLSAPCSFTSARSLQNHANSLQVSDKQVKGKFLKLLKTCDL